MDLKAVKKHGFKRVGGCFKLALDGCFGSEDAALKEPYANDPNNYGVLNYPQERVNEFAIGAKPRGLGQINHARHRRCGGEQCKRHMRRLIR